MLRAIIFDFDGVLIDSEPIHLKLSQQIAAQEGWTLTEAEYYQKLLPLDDRAMVARLGQLHGRRFDAGQLDELVAWKARSFAKIIADGLPLLPGAAEFVQRAAARFPLAIASGSRREEIEPLLQKAGLAGKFTVLATTYESGRSKPHPDVYLKALEGLGRLPCFAEKPLLAAECLAIEDAPGGVDAAHTAGIKCLAFTHSRPAEELGHADWVARDFAEVDLARIEAGF